MQGFSYGKDLLQADPAERFSPPGGFLTFDFDTPAEMLQRPPELGYGFLSVEQAQPHIDLVNHQLEQVPGVPLVQDPGAKGGHCYAKSVVLPVWATFIRRSQPEL